MKQIHLNSGPEYSEYEQLSKIIDKISSEGVGSVFRNLVTERIKSSSLFSHTYLKPYGYAGDFELINNIYLNYVSKDPDVVKWDLFYQWTPATQAVRNRKLYLTKVLSKATEPKNVLILGSGPGNDVQYYLDHNEVKHNFTLLDIDEKAIYFAKALTSRHSQHVKFVKGNALRYRPEIKYDLIYSSGLFDYFNDKFFKLAINHYQHYLNPGGEMIIGNFSKDNPTQNIMETMTEWYLHHRTADQLIELFTSGDNNFKECYVAHEPTGINLFIHASI